MRALRDGACGDGWPRDETLSANAPELCAYCGFTIYMRRYENRSPVLVGTGTSARTATRGYCTELQLRMESKMECYHVARPRPESPHTS